MAAKKKVAARAKKKPAKAAPKKPRRAVKAKAPGNSALVPTPIETAVTRARTAGQIITVLHQQLYPWADQPRRVIPDGSIALQAAVIASTDDVLVPLIARPGSRFAEFVDTATGKPADMYEIIAGERRWRGVALLIRDGRWPADRPLRVDVRDLTDAEALRIAAAENQGRAALHPLDEADMFRRLVADGATKVSIVRDGFADGERTVYRRLKLLNMVPMLQDALRAERLTLDQALAFAEAAADRQIEVFQKLSRLGALPAANAIEAALREGGDGIVAEIGHTRDRIEGALGRPTAKEPLPGAVEPAPDTPPASPPAPEPEAEPPVPAAARDDDQASLGLDGFEDAADETSDASPLLEQVQDGLADAVRLLRRNGGDEFVAMADRLEALIDALAEHVPLPSLSDLGGVEARA